MPSFHQRQRPRRKKLEVISGRIDDPEIVSHLSEEVLSSLKNDLELLEEAGDPFDKDKVSKGELTPLFSVPP